MAETISFYRAERSDHIYGALNARVTAKTRLGEIPVFEMCLFEKIGATDSAPSGHLPEHAEEMPGTEEQYP